jgi:D-serine deaminase-like pyridoxal phosphate-dependent protein
VPGVTEIRPGTYVFNDVQQLRLGVATMEMCAARVLVTVVARPTAERFLVDGGTKSFSSDGGDGPPFPGRGLVIGRPDLFLDFMTEEHGVGHIEGGADVSIGERLQVVPLHVCSCVNLFDVAFGIRDGRVDHEIAIEARGSVR